MLKLAVGCQLLSRVGRTHPKRDGLPVFEAPYQKGVGVIGDLVHSESPLNFWSEITLVVWDVPRRVRLWEVLQNLDSEVEINLLDASSSTPAQWQQIKTEMVVIAGEWSGLVSEPVRKRLQLFWKRVV